LKLFNLFQIRLHTLMLGHAGGVLAPLCGADYFLLSFNSREISSSVTPRSTSNTNK
jgi:hypothetical protein